MSSWNFAGLPPQPHQAFGEWVFLLHGLARTAQSMETIEARLSSLGYRVINLNYPSTKYTIEYLSEITLGDAVQQIASQSPSKIHFVTHSMGGILVRYYLKYHRLPNLGRVVMTSPPNQGSELVDYLKNITIFAEFIGPSGRELGTDSQSVPLSLGAVNFELGVIAGSSSLNPLYSLLLSGPDDGTVPIERTKVEGMKDFLVLPYAHPIIMKSEEVIQQVIYFLKYGSFQKERP